MKWNDLELVAVEGLLRDSGIASRSPIVRASDGGQIFIIHRVDDVDPEPDSRPISEEELNRNITEGDWIRVERRPAQADAIVLVASARFREACRIAHSERALEWRSTRVETNEPQPLTLPPPKVVVEIAYVNVEQARAWCAGTLEDLTKWIERKLAAIVSRGASRSARVKDEIPTTKEDLIKVLRQARYLAAPTSVERLKLAALELIAMEHFDPDSTPLVLDAAVRDGWSEDHLELYARGYKDAFAEGRTREESKGPSSSALESWSNTPVAKFKRSARPTNGSTESPPAAPAPR